MKHAIVSDQVVEELLASGEAHKIQFPEGYIVLQHYPSNSELFLLLIKWQPGRLCFRAMLDVLIHIAKSKGCDKITGIGRNGWYRKLAPYGFTQLEDGTIQLFLTNIEGDSHGRF